MELLLYHLQKVTKSFASKQGNNNVENNNGTQRQIKRKEKLMVLKDSILIFQHLFINLFMAGFIFMCTHKWLENTKINNIFLTIWSLIISVVINLVYSSIHLFVLPTVKFPDNIKAIIFSITGFIAAIILFKIKHSKTFSFILYKLNNKTVNDDIFRDLIDNEKVITMRICLRGSNLCYIGRFSHREEHGPDSWISLINYVILNTQQNVEVFNTDTDHDAATIILNLRDVETIEIFYDDDSKVWENLIEVK